MIAILALVLCTVVALYILRWPKEKRATSEITPDAPTNLVTAVQSVDHRRPSDPAAASRSQGETGITLADIPAGILHNQIVRLSPAARVEALKNLSDISFHTNDVESLRVDDEGGVFFVCSFSPSAASLEDKIPEANEGLVAARVTAVQGASVPISAPPIRHSRPGSSNVLYLDFNGQVISNTLWNSNTNYGPTASWDCRPYDKDGDETTFNASEQAAIIEIWERVSEDYAPFDIDVTTEEPLAWTSTTGHALITPTTDKNGVHCPHYGYGGVAYVNVFGNSTYSYNSSNARSPAWCKDYGAASTAEVISHEFGHNVSLSHDGTSTKSYYSGHGNGVTSIKWGPIMGTGYGDDVSQWCKGEYYDANQTQDDLDRIKNKLGYRPDDHGDTDATASILNVVGTGDIEDGGVIETTGDPDVFAVLTGSGVISIQAHAYKASSGTWGANLDIVLELYDSSGTLIATNNPELDVDAAISETVAAGTYYLHVKPTGVGHPLSNPPTGYTVYGSLGQYWLTGAVSSDADNDLIPNAWEFQYFNSITGAIPSVDSDGDGADNLTEYVSGYNPTDKNSVFKMNSFSLPTSTTEPTIIHWPTLPGHVYSVSHSSNLRYIGFTPFPDAVDLPSSRNSYTDTVEHAESTIFYRVEVKIAQ